MISVVQRVSEASVSVGGAVIGAIGNGMVALVAVCDGDEQRDIDWTASKLAGLRIFRNAQKHFDRSVGEIEAGAILLISNFTVAADTKRGRRPSLDRAAAPEQAERLFEALVEAIRTSGITVATGQFGGDMRVALVNDGPATFILDSRAG